MLVYLTKVFSIEVRIIVKMGMTITSNNFPLPLLGSATPSPTPEEDGNFDDYCTPDESPSSLPSPAPMSNSNGGIILSSEPLSSVTEGLTFRYKKCYGWRNHAWMAS